MVTKNLSYYLSLDYDVIVSRMEEDGDVIYKAYSGDLDSYVFYGAGETKAEALESFENTKNELFKDYLEEGRNIPEPTREDKTLPSGKFLLRIDPRIHQKLVQLARKRKKSLNSFIDQILVSYTTADDIIARCAFDLSHLQRVQYRINEYKGSQLEATNPAYQGYSTEAPSHKKVA